jgi:positive regulator of sigma E activity
MLQGMRSAVPVIIAGIVIWTIALVIAIIVNAVAKIILTCLLGIVLGFIGIRYTKRRAKREER